MSGPTCDLWLRHGLPFVVIQALDDTTLPHSARLLMWHLGKRLDILEFQSVKIESLVSETRMGKATVSEALTLLVARGYVAMRPGLRRARVYRLPATRLSDLTTARAA